jgi:hypothetical protein
MSAARSPCHRAPHNHLRHRQLPHPAHPMHVHLYLRTLHHSPVPVRAPTLPAEALPPFHPFFRPSPCCGSNDCRTRTTAHPHHHAARTAGECANPHCDDLNLRALHEPNPNDASGAYLFVGAYHACDTCHSCSSCREVEGGWCLATPALQCSERGISVGAVHATAAPHRRQREARWWTARVSCCALWILKQVRALLQSTLPHSEKRQHPQGVTNTPRASWVSVCRGVEEGLWATGGSASTDVGVMRGSPSTAVAPTTLHCALATRRETAS